MPVLQQGNPQGELCITDLRTARIEVICPGRGLEGIVLQFQLGLAGLKRNRKGVKHYYPFFFFLYIYQ